MRILMCFALLFSFSSTSFAYTPPQPHELDRALDRLSVVFDSARTPHSSLWGTFLWGVVSGGVLYSALVLWTGHHKLANDILNYALVGNVVWAVGDGLVSGYIDRSIATRERPAQDYMEKEVLPDFFRLPRARQLELAEGNRDLEQFLLRLDAAIQETAPVTVDAPLATPRTS